MRSTVVPTATTRPPRRARALDRGDGLRPELEALAMHPVLVGVERPDRQEGAGADVQRDERMRDPALGERWPSAAGVKWSAAVGAATAPARAANMV